MKRQVKKHQRVNQQQNNNRTLKKVVKDRLIILFIIGVYVCISLILHIGCPIKKLTGIYCMGCGMSRALMYALKLDFAKAFAFHPLFWMVIVGIPVFLFWEKIPGRIGSVLLWLTVIMFIVVYMFRMIYVKDSVLQFKPEDGYIGRYITAFID